MSGFYARRRPFADETLDGYMIRLCEANGIPTMRWLLDEIADWRYSNLDRGVVGVLTSSGAVRALEELADLEPGALAPYTYTAGFWGDSDIFRRGLFRWPTSAMAIRHHQVCPACLRDSDYHRAAWAYYHAPVCTVHQVALIDRCPVCHKPIRCSRTAVSRCGTCGADLRSAAADSVPTPVAEFAKRIQEPHIVGLGSARYTEPVTPDELFRLWCLAHIPRLGEPVDVTTAFKAARLPVARRLEALSGLADAWVDGRLDSARIRTHIFGRWAHLSAIPCDTLRQSHMRSACQRLRLNRHIVHVLIHDDAPGRLRDSLVAFGTQPPQLHTREEVACFLEVPVAALEALSGWFGILTDPTNGDGFDADQLLEAKRFLSQMLTAAEVDGTIGVDGAVPELEYRQLLAPWPGLELQPARYPASTLVQLFDRIFESIVSPDAADLMTRLLDALPETSDPQPLVSSMALIQNGGLRAYGWAPPFRVVDLRVNVDELRRALAACRLVAGES